MTTKDKANLYYEEMKALASKITKLDKTSLSDFERLEKLFKIGGISEYTIKSLYENCGFNSWRHYLSEKKSPNPSKLAAISCVDDMIWIVVRNIELATRSTVC